ncbi:MAG TPA: hypothetical protein VHN58_12505 [Croceicoccus sp.]|nr:hypothetical protein [Croceicoccus sp.]
MKKLHGLLLAGCSAVILSGCGPDDLAELGTGGDVIINNPTPAPTPAPTPTPTSGAGLVTPAAGCPTIANPVGLTDGGTITGPQGTWRVCTLPAKFTASSTLPKLPGLLYQLAGRVDVGTDGGFTASSADTNVTLTIEPGVIVYGGTGVSWLAVNRGNKINAVGTATQPIIFTSRDNVLGLNNDESSGQWGGVVLMGRGRVTDCTVGTVSGGTCERQVEGAADPALFGGNNDADNSGKMDYVQIRYSGFVLSGDKELQSLTPSAIGSGTQLAHIMSFNSSDDGAEFFGGFTRMKHYIVVGAEDDSIDADTGARVEIQYAIIKQRTSKADALLEIDSDGLLTDTPRTDVKLTNATMIAGNPANSDQASMLLRGNSDNLIMNSIVVSPNNECLRLSGTSVTADFKSTVMQCLDPKYIDSGVPAGTAAAAFGDGTDNNDDDYTPTLASLFINGTNETAVAGFNANSVSSFFTTTTYIGAVKDSADTWYAGWTCNSSHANFGTGNSGLCTALPTT